MSKEIRVRIASGGNVQLKRITRHSLAPSFFANFFTRQGRETNKLLWALFSDDEKIVKDAVVQLGEARAKKAVPLLHGLLSPTRDAALRAAAVKALVKIGRRDSAFALLEAFCNDEDVLVKRKIAELMGEFGKALGEEKIPLKQVPDAVIPETLRRATPAEGQDTLSYREFIAFFLMQAVENKKEDKFVRSYSTRSLAELNAVEAAPLLIKIMLGSSEDVGLRVESVATLADFKASQAGAACLQFLQQNRTADESELLFIAEALKSLGTNEQLKGIEELIQQYSATSSVVSALMEARKEIISRELFRVE